MNRNILVYIACATFLTLGHSEETSLESVEAAESEVTSHDAEETRQREIAETEARIREAEQKRQREIAENEAKVRDAKEKKQQARVSQLEADMQQVGGKTAYKNFGAKTASANPQIDGYGFFATADFLFWKLYEGGTDYLLKGQDVPVKGKLQHANFNWEPGFKVGAGYLFDRDGWDTQIEYTYYKTHAHHTTHGNFLFPQVGNPTLELTQANAKWHVFFQNIDLVLGRNYFVSNYFSLHPLFGLTSAWIDQHRHFRFLATSEEHIALNSRNDFWGIGPHLACNGQLYLGRNFSVYGNVAGNLLWGDFHVSEKEANKTAGTEFYHLHNNLRRMVASIAFALGLSYETSFAKDCYHLGLKAGYENQYWFRQNQLPLFDSTGNTFHRLTEDLGLQGLTVEVRLDF
jgi:hypothetical protein